MGQANPVGPCGGCGLWALHWGPGLRQTGMCPPILLPFKGAQGFPCSFCPRREWDLQDTAPGTLDREGPGPSSHLAR